jgi:hypothetical protein
MHELFYGRLKLGSTILGVKALADDEMDLLIPSYPSLLESTVCVRNSFFDIEAVQINLMRFTVLSQIRRW